MTASAPPPSKRWSLRGVLGIGLCQSVLRLGGQRSRDWILPAFLASLGAPAYALGVIEGVSDGLSSFAKLAGGWIADRPKLRKPTGIVGYAATGISTFAYAFAQSWPAILLMRALGWVGRGSRGPSRDTLLADAVAPEQEGRAFGFERAMDNGAGRGARPAMRDGAARLAGTARRVALDFWYLGLLRLRCVCVAPRAARAAGW